VRWYAAAHTPLYDFRGLRVGCLLLLHDVTAEHRIHAQLMAQQRSLVALHERERLARDLHDGVAQVLSYASLQAEAARHLIDIGQGATAAAQLARLATVLQEAHAEVRGQIQLLHTSSTAPQPFFTALRHSLDGFTSNYAIETRLAIAPDLREEMFAPETQAQLLHILQEALANTRKHSRARSIQVTFTTANDVLRMGVVDDGVGFAPGATVAGDLHWGLRFMRERAAEMGGALRISAQPGAGAGVVVEIPWKEG
jgi:signal transduction histidine kinase